MFNFTLSYDNFVHYIVIKAPFIVDFLSDIETNVDFLLQFQEAIFNVF